MGLATASRFAILAAFACCVAGCVIIPAPVTSSTGSVSPQRPFRLIDDGATTPLSRGATDAVRQLLTVQGYRIDSSANLGLEVSIARRGTDVAFSAGQGLAGSGTGR